MIYAKLKNKEGASITYALLLFLVCAVIGSIMIAAGTAASGRMSKAVEMDQRYYSVMSAAELLMRELDSETVAIVNKGTVTDSGSDSESFNQSDDQYPMIEVDGSLTSSLSGSLKPLTYVTAVLAGLRSIETENSWVITAAGSVSDSLSPLSVTVVPSIRYVKSSSDEESLGNLNLEGDETISGDPYLVLNLYNTYSDAAGETASSETDRFTVRLVFCGDVETWIDDQTDDEGKIIRTVTKEVHWSFYSIETVSS